MSKNFFFVTLFIIATCYKNSAYCQTEDSFITIKDSKIHFNMKGNGKPAVVFVSGLAEDHQTWKNIQDSISNLSTTLSYDRAGLGRSEYHGEKKDLRSLVKELHTLIHKVKISKPFILVGHSLGCQIVKKYSALYPENVKGIIFLDPGFNEQKLKKRLPDSVWNEREKTLKKYLPEFNDAQQAERINLNRICEVADKTKIPKKIPVILFTATHINPGFPGSKIELEVKKESHLQWLSSLHDPGHYEIKESRHYIHNDMPSIVIDTILGMIRLVYER